MPYMMGCDIRAWASTSCSGDDGSPGYAYIEQLHRVWIIWEFYFVWDHQMEFGSSVQNDAQFPGYWRDYYSSDVYGYIEDVDTSQVLMDTTMPGGAGACEGG